MPLYPLVEHVNGAACLTSDIVSVRPEAVSARGTASDRRSLEAVVEDSDAIGLVQSEARLLIKLPGGRKMS